jgi:uncharacterized protein
MIFYLHGFRSSPLSAKARLLAERLTELKRQDEWHCPLLCGSPMQAVALVEAMAAGAEKVTLIGSSLGGYLATWLAEQHGWRAVLLNPAVRLRDCDLTGYLGVHPACHGNHDIVVTPEHLEELRALGIDAITRPERYYLLAARDDEVIDYRQMLSFYSGVTTTLIEKAGHAIDNFSEYVDRVLAFCDE